MDDGGVGGAAYEDEGNSRPGIGERVGRRLGRGEGDDATMEPRAPDQREEVAPPCPAREGRKARRRNERIDLLILNQDHERVSPDVCRQALGGRESARRVRECHGQSKGITDHAYAGSSITTAVQLWKPPN